MASFEWVFLLVVWLICKAAIPNIKTNG